MLSHIMEHKENVKTKDSGTNGQKDYDSVRPVTSRSGRGAG